MTSSTDTAGRPGRRRDPSFIVNVVDLRRHLGDRREIDRDVTLEALTLGDTVVEAGTSIGLHLVLESIPAGIAVTGRIEAAWSGTCRRCLDPVVGDLDVVVDEVFAVDHVEGETYPLGHETIDLEPLVRETVLLSLPIGPLCREDCPGPDPEAFPVEIERDPTGDDPSGEGDDDDRPRDPRWAALDVLREQFEDGGGGDQAGE